jgi:hypothetical protein
MIRVNGELIDPQLVEETFSRIKAEAEARLQISCCERDDEFIQQAEQEVIDSILIAQEAETRHPKMPAEAVRTRLEETIKQYREHGASWDMLEAQRDQLREECEANLRMETLLDELLDGTGEPGEEELRGYYDEHQSEFRSVAEVRCQHLIKYLERHDDPVTLLETMRVLREAALEGAEFGELAKRETEKESGETDLGWIQLDRPANPFESMIFTMRDGEVSPVVSYEQAYHLIKVTGTKPSVTPPFEELRDELLQRYRFDHRRAVLQSFATGLREQADIEHLTPEDDADD